MKKTWFVAALLGCCLLATCATSVVVTKEMDIKARQYFKKRVGQLTIEEGVTEIPDYAFAGNQLTSLVIPKSVKSIGEGAFRNNRLTRLPSPKASRRY
jgi:hypothetical protein